MIRVMIVATYSEIREGLSTVLRLAGSFDIAGVVPGLSDTVPQPCADVALVDLEMPAGEGYETIRRLKRLCPRIAVIALTAHDYPASLESAIRAGARTVMVKGLDVPEMIAAIQLAVRTPEGQQETNDES